MCRRHQIPLPGRGYWRRKETGHKVRQTPLPPLNDSGQETIYIDRPDSRPTPPPTAELHPLIAFERQPENRIVVDDDVQANHPLIRATRHSRKIARSLEWNAPKPPRLDIRVTAAPRPRALRIMQALLAALERRGYKVEATGDGKTKVTILGESLDIRLDERYKQVPHEPTAYEREQMKRGWSVPRYDSVAAGLLTLKIDNVWAPRQSWTDGKK